jgi:diguanylate cyclase (GGDEF)-like protein
MTSHALIIEDDRDTAALFSHILEFIGFETEIVRSEEKAQNRLRQSIPDIVLLDLLLSQNVSGLNILDYIKGEDRLSTSRVIVITGHHNLAESVEDKADLVLIKPIDAKQLSTMVLRLVPDHICENFLYYASHDPLTDLMNYARFKDRLLHAVSRARRTESLVFAIIFLRLVGFPTVSRTYGQTIMNQFLLAFVGKVQSQIREIDTLSRLSEDKFAILLENILDTENGPIVAKRIQRALETPFHIQGQEISIETSIDICYDDLVEGLEIFLKTKE